MSQILITPLDLQNFNYHLSDSPDSTSCLPRLSLVDLGITPTPGPCTRYTFSWWFFKDSEPVRTQLLLFFLFWNKSCSFSICLRASSEFSQVNACSLERAVLKCWTICSEPIAHPKITAICMEKSKSLLIFHLSINNYCSFLERSLHMFWKRSDGKQQQEMWPGNKCVKQWEVLQSKRCQI